EALPVADRDETLAELYERWDDDACKDTVFKPENLKRLLDYWVVAYEADSLEKLEAGLREADLETLPLRGTWMAVFLERIDTLSAPKILVQHRFREVLTAREAVAERFAERYLDRYLASAASGDAPHVLNLLNARLRDSQSQPKLISWLVDNGESIDVFVQALTIELWDSAFVSYAAAGANEDADALAARLRDVGSNPFTHVHRGVGMESTFLVGLDQVLARAVPRLETEAAAVFTSLVEGMLAKRAFLNYKIAAFLEGMQAYIDAQPDNAQLPAIEAGLRLLAARLADAEFEEFEWRAPAISELQTALFHIITRRKGWGAGTEASAVDMLTVLDDPAADALERSAAHYALGQFGPHVFTDLLDRRYAAPPTGGDAFARCVRALFEALEIAPPPGQ
ncbi:MAG: hypothetical protein KDD51_08615, partial [Bdellovibrionales bacterium]|nr:hypothetical protein [Bdellovibrionales bacterium]